MLSFNQPDFQHCHKQLMICVAVCSWLRAIIHQAATWMKCMWNYSISTQ